MNAITKIKAGTSFFRDFFQVFGGLVDQLLNHKNTPDSFQAMIRLFTRTQGWSNDLFSKGISIFYPEPKRIESTGVLGKVSVAKLNEILQTLETDGYYVIKNGLDENTCDELLAFALKAPARLRGKNELKPYNRTKPEVVRYDFNPDDLIEHPTIQKLMIDESILSVSQAYLKTIPILDLVAMWWHTSFQKEPDADAAQFFHFDMDRIKWIKIFFYLTDVGTENGPHCFIRGSQRTGGIPKQLLHKGYARLSDEEVMKHYASTDYVEFIAKRGTIIIEDTRGLHKGKHVKKGDRLIFQLQYSNSLFGGSDLKSTIHSFHSDKIKHLLKIKSRILKKLT